MTISTTVRKAIFAGNASATSFAFTFKVFAAGDVQVTLTSVAGVESVLTKDSDYTISLNGDQNVSPGATITYPVSGTPLAVGEKLTVAGSLAATQGTDLTNGGGFFPETIEDRLDYITILAQQNEDRLSRTPQVAASDDAPALSLGTALARANKIVTFDANGNVELATTIPANTLTEANVEAVLTQAGIGRVFYPVTAAETSAGYVDAEISHQFNYGDLRRYKLVGSGDETALLVKAIAACAAGNYTLKGNPGTTYTLTGSSSIDISGVKNIDLRGCTVDASAVTGTIVFLATGTKTAFKTGASFTAGDGIIDVTGSGQTFERGDVILITSLEAHPNPARTEYMKGTRTYVDSQSGNDLRVFPQIDFSYTSCYVWKVTPNVVNWKGGTIIGNETVNQAGIVFDLCTADTDVEVRYCAQAGIRFENSRGRYNGKMRYCYLGASGTSYCISVSDLSEVDVVGAELLGARHAIAVGGGTWLQTESGGSSGQAAYPGSCRVVGGIYTSSRSGTSFPSDPSLEIGAIDCHGIAKQLTVTGATVHGGFKLASIESCRIENCFVTFRNYNAVELVDSASADWGHIEFVNNHCNFIGAFAPGATPTAVPAFINAGSTELIKRFTCRGNRFSATDATINATVGLGLLRGCSYIEFENNIIDVALSAVSIAATFEIWGTKYTRVEGNILRNCNILCRPIGQTGVLELHRNRVDGSGLSGLRWTANSLDATAYFREVHVYDNNIRNCYQGGIAGRSTEVKRLYMKNNVCINNNVSGGSTAYISAGIGIQKVSDSDLLELIVFQGNVAISDSNAVNAHTRGIYFAVSGTLGTDLVLQGNISDGDTSGAINVPTGAGAVTILRSEDNTYQTLQTYTTGSHGTLRSFAGTTTAAQALQLLETLVDDLKTQGKVL